MDCDGGGQGQRRQLRGSFLAAGRRTTARHGRPSTPRSGPCTVPVPGSTESPLEPNWTPPQTWRSPAVASTARALLRNLRWNAVGPSGDSSRLPSWRPSWAHRRSPQRWHTSCWRSRRPHPLAEPRAEGGRSGRPVPRRASRSDTIQPLRMFGSDDQVMIHLQTNASER